MIRRFPTVVFFQHNSHATWKKAGTVVTTSIPLLGVFLCGVFSILFAKQTFAPPSLHQYAVLQNPESSSAYYDAAARIDPYFLSPTSRLLVRLALDREPQAENVLGATTQTPLVTFAKQRQRDASLFDQWMAVVSKYPDYPEAKLRAAYYGLKLGKPAETITNLLDGASPLLTSGHAIRALRARIMK